MTKNTIIFDFKFWMESSHNPFFEKTPLNPPLSQQNLDFTNIDTLMTVQGRFYELSPDQQKQMLLLEKKYCKRTKLPTSGNDPFWYHIYQDSLPFEQVYRVVPQHKDRVVNNAAELKVKGFKKRQFFSGWNNYTAAELQVA